MEHDEANEADRLLRIEEVGPRLNVGRSTVYRLLGSGALPSVKVAPRCWRVSERAIREYLAACKYRPRTPAPAPVAEEATRAEVAAALAAEGDGRPLAGSLVEKAARASAARTEAEAAERAARKQAAAAREEGIRQRAELLAARRTIRRPPASAAPPRPKTPAPVMLVPPPKYKRIRVVRRDGE